MWFHGEDDSSLLSSLGAMYSSVITARLAFIATPTRPPAFNKRLWEQVVLQTKSAVALIACPLGSVASEPPSHAISLPGFIWLLAWGYSAVRRGNARLVTLHFTHDDLGMIGTLFLLFSIHGRQRDDERDKRLQYWREQVKRIFSYTTGEQLVLTNITHHQERFPPKHLADARDSPGFHFPSREFFPSFAAVWHDNGRLSCPNIAI
jgi:hypothetical protein